MHHLSRHRTQIETSHGTLLILLILLVTTRIFGEVAERLGQPSLVGELITLFLTFQALALILQIIIITEILDLYANCHLPCEDARF